MTICKRVLSFFHGCPASYLTRRLALLQLGPPGAKKKPPGPSMLNHN